MDAIGDPEHVGVIVWAQWQDAGNVWTSFPLENPATSNGGEAFTHWYQIENRSTAQSSADVAIHTSDTPVEKVDDALNLAIIFHQHQPYYKNKLTGMVEMPWVRVHGMTEYVDSPGILSNTDTKVTYNLVPSFIEQLLDYSKTEYWMSYRHRAAGLGILRVIPMPRPWNYTQCNSSPFGIQVGFTMLQPMILESVGCNLPVNAIHSCMT